MKDDILVCIIFLMAGFCPTHRYDGYILPVSGSLDSFSSVTAGDKSVRTVKQHVSNCHCI